MLYNGVNENPDQSVRLSIRVTFFKHTPLRLHGLGIMILVALGVASGALGILVTLTVALTADVVGTLLDNAFDIDEMSHVL